MNGGFRDNVGVESVAEVDGVDVVTIERPARREGVSESVVSRGRIGQRVGHIVEKDKRGLTIPSRCT